MLRLCSQITIQHFNRKTDGSVDSKGDKYNLDSVQEVSVKSGWDTMVDSATLSLPKNAHVRVNDTGKIISWARRNIVFKDSFALSEKPSSTLFSVKDCIKIELGYNNKFETVFYGVITEISEKAPIQLACADILWLLKNVKMPLEKFSEPPKLTEILKKLTAAAKEDADVKLLLDFSGTKDFSINMTSEDIPLGGFNISDKSVYQVLEELKTNYELEIFVRNNIIYVGEAYVADPVKDADVIKIGTQFNVISDDLIAVQKNTLNVQVKVVGIPSQGKSSDVVIETVGEGKNTILIEKYDITDSAVLKEIGNRKMKKMEYDGYKGHFVTFGTPFIRHGNTINLRDSILVAKDSQNYRVKSVEYSFGSGGYRQKVELHEKA